jgi:hypothetical protein
MKKTKPGAEIKSGAMATPNYHFSYLHVPIKRNVLYCRRQTDEAYSGYHRPHESVTHLPTKNKNKEKRK